MIRNSLLTNAVRSCTFRFKRATERVDIFRKTGGTKHVMIRRRKEASKDYARLVLKDAGMSHDDIEEFIAQHDKPKNKNH